MRQRTGFSAGGIEPSCSEYQTLEELSRSPFNYVKYYVIEYCIAFGMLRQTGIIEAVRVETRE